MPHVVRGRTRKIVQLVGAIDRQRGGPPPQSFLKIRPYGTDLGTPLDVGPRELFFLFGDAWTAEGDRHDTDPSAALMTAPGHRGIPQTAKWSGFGELVSRTVSRASG